MIPVRQLDSSRLRPVYHMDLWFMCSAIDWKNTCFFLLLCVVRAQRGVLKYEGRLGQLKGVHCPTAAPEIIKRRGTIIKMFAAAFEKLPRHGRNTTSAHQTHTHTHIDMYIYLDVWPGTSTYLLLLGRLINWLLKVLKIENKILRYQNKIPARVRVRGRGGTAHLIRPSRLVRQLGSLRMSGGCAISPAVIRPTDHSCGSVHMCIQQ